MSKLRALLRSRVAQIAVAVVGLGVASSAAWGLPWDLDMTDSQAIKGYERVMLPLPEGVVAQPHVLSPKGYAPTYAFTAPEVAGMKPPFESTEDTIAQGERMYGIYCTPCHGDGKELGPVAQPGRVPAVPQLSGDKGVLQRRSDGWVYLTIRHGSLSQIMPAYGYMMTEQEMWATVHYLRTMENGQYVPPAQENPQ